MGGMICFLLNDIEISLIEVGLCDMLLDFLCLNCCLIGIKEGCVEGDCGVCIVLVGCLYYGWLYYELINVCICFLVLCYGCYVVMVEYLCGLQGLYLVQVVMVEYYGS